MKKRILIILEHGAVTGLASENPELFDDVDFAVLDYGQLIKDNVEHRVNISFPTVLLTNQTSETVDEIFADNSQETDSGLN